MSSFLGRKHLKGLDAPKNFPVFAFSKTSASYWGKLGRLAKMGSVDCWKTAVDPELINRHSLCQKKVIQAILDENKILASFIQIFHSTSLP